MKKRGKKKGNGFFNDKRLLAVTIVAFFAFAFLVGFVNVDSGATVTGAATSFISDVFTDWGSGQVDVNIAKYLFFFILIIFIFSLLNMTGIPPYPALQWLLAIFISFLGIAYIAPEEIFSILTTYTALGLTLSVVMPFIILVLGSAAILSPIKMGGTTTKFKGFNIGSILLVLMMWLFYTAFLVYKLIGGYGGEAEMSTGVNIIIGGVLFFSLLILIFNKGFRDWIAKLGIEIKRRERKFVKENVEEAADVMIDANAAARALKESALTKYKGKY